MPDIVLITLIGTLAGVLGTGLGGLTTVLIGNPENKTLSFLLAFAGGIMLSVVFIDLLPEAIEYGGMITPFIGLIMGITLLIMLDLYLPHSHFSHLTNGECSTKQSRYIRTSMLIGFGIAMHNLPEGLAIGAGYIASDKLGLGLAIVIGLHNIPEGMAMAAPMKCGLVNSWRIIFWTGMAGLPMGIGAFIGAQIGLVSPTFLAVALGFAAGAMLYIVFDELLPDSQEMAVGHSSTFGAVVGAVFGMILIMLLH